MVHTLHFQAEKCKAYAYITGHGLTSLNEHTAKPQIAAAELRTLPDTSRIVLTNRTFRLPNNQIGRAAIQVEARARSGACVLIFGTHSGSSESILKMAVANASSRCCFGLWYGSLYEHECCQGVTGSRRQEST